MCGICGVVSSSQIADAGKLLQLMNDSLRHRGPDDAGYWTKSADKEAFWADPDSPAAVQERSALLPENTEAYVGMGHRRLSIIDLSTASHQPRSSASGRYVLCYNGEIYNYLELRADLIALGYQFESQGDAEVLLAAWEEWQEQALHRFEGMWAFALYDRDEDKLWLVRDPSGVKPLFYSQQAGILFFASEPKALLATTKVPAKLNQKALYAFLVHASLDENEGHLLENIQEIPAGQLLTFDCASADLQLRNYHQAHFKAKLASSHFPDNINENIRKHIEHTVRLRLRSDVKIGASLSGGLDSSTLAALAAKSPGFPLFTAVYEGYPENEASYAEELAKKLQADWQQVAVGPDLLHNRLEALVSIQDGPLLALSTFAQLLINEAAKKQGVTILLDGQGGDELFSGYDRYWLSYYRESWEKAKIKRLANGLLQPNHLAYMVKGLVYSLVPAAIYHPSCLPLWQWQLNRRKPELRFLKSDFKRKYSQVSLKFIGNLPKSGVNAQQIDEMYGHALKNLLRWGDRNSMSVAIENRAPFADDPHLADILLHLPVELKMHAGQSKLLLRAAMQNELPTSILTRKDKQGFTTPMQAWMRELWPNWKKYLEYLPEVVDIKLIEQQSESLLKQDTGAAFLLRLVSLGAWLKNLKETVKSA